MSRLPNDITLGPVKVSVGNLARAADFYTGVLGFEQLSSSPGKVLLGAGVTTLIALFEKPGAKPQPRHSTGLYHIAVLLPTPADLARLIIHLAQTKYPLSGYSDHLVSEAFYLNDPDGNGLELYRDRPRSEWPRADGGMVRMDNAPIDFDDFFATAEQEAKTWSGMPAGTSIGHLHLKVGHSDLARNFYGDVIGFDVMAYFPGAAFVSAGGYHHHLGMNQWESRGATEPPEDSVGLIEWSIVVPDAATLGEIEKRALEASALLERGEAFVLIEDPWHTKVRVTTG